MSFDNYIYANFNFEFNKMIRKINKNKYSNLVFICIGTNKIVGDSLGPITGEMLKRNLERRNIKIFGDLSNNVNTHNITQKIAYIKRCYDNPYIISIDSALSETIVPETVYILKTGMIPGSALKKNLSRIGNASIKGIVGKDEKNLIKNYYNLAKADYRLVLRLSKNISKIIINSIKFLNL